MPETKVTKPVGRISADLGQQKHKEFSAMAKKAGVSNGALAKALVLDGMDRIKSGSFEVTAGVTLIPKS